MSEPIRVCGVAGSLRRDSYNRALLHAAQELAPAALEIVTFDRIAELPPFNADVEAQGDPEPVTALKQAIGAAAGLLIATPEYNFGPSGVLKNAIDWASRPPRNSVLNASDKFDAHGRLTDEATRKILAEMLHKFVDWIQRLR